MAEPLRGGRGGLKGRAIKEKRDFSNLFSNVPKFQRPLSWMGRWGLGLNGPAIKRRTFFSGFPNNHCKNIEIQTSTVQDQN